MMFCRLSFPVAVVPAESEFEMKDAVCGEAQNRNSELRGEQEQPKDQDANLGAR